MTARPTGARLLRGALTGRRPALLRAAGWTAVEGLPAMLSGLLVARALDQGFLAGAAWAGLGWLGVLLATGVVSAVATSRLYPQLAAVVEPARDSLVRSVTAGTLTRAVRAATAPGSGPGAGQGIAQVVQQVDSVRNLLSALVRNVRQLVVPVVGAGIGLALLSPLVALLVLPGVLVATVAYLLLLRPAVRAEGRRLDAERAYADSAELTISGLRDLTATGATGAAAGELALLAQRARRAAVVAGYWATARSLVAGLAAAVPLLTVLAAGIVLVPEGRLGLGTVIGAITYVQTGLAPAVRSVVQTGTAWLLQLGVLAGQLAETAGAAAAGPTGRAATSTGTAAPVALAGVTFGYGPHSAPVVRDLDLAVAPGEHLAVVGPSGVGKSTLALLIAGVLAPDRGSVTVAGRPAWDGSGAPCPEVTLVPQQAYVFAGTVRENLAYLAPAATDGELSAAISAFGLAAVVARAGGLDATLPAGGASLSRGERQRICLARTWLRRAPVVVLDEAASDLDVDAERQAERAFRAAGSTLIVIAHRLDSAARADRVLLLDGDDVVLGAEREVLARSGLYRDLVGMS
jgi:ATP-binding cassette subfamily C protein